MSWWKYPARSEPASEPMRADILPGALSARIHVHQVPSPHGSMPCWSYVTDGLAALDQAEIAFTLRRDPGEPDDGCPDDPLRLFATIYQLARDGRRVTAGGVTEFGEARFFDRHLLYAAAQPMPGVELPLPCLAALLITDDELRAVRTFGASRVLARLGQASSYYPFPPWSDRRRRGLALARTLEASLLSKIPRLSTLDVHVGVRDDQVVVSALRGAQPPWQDRLAQFPDTAPLALLTAIDPTADGCMTWVPGQTGPEAIVPPGSAGAQVCGCFVALVGDQAVNRGKLLEDGFAIELTAEAWHAIRRALVDGQDLTIPATGEGMALALRWHDPVAIAPVDSGVRYTPTAAAVTAPTGALALGPVRLLTPEAQFAERASAEEMGMFCREIQRCADRLLAGHDGQLELKLQVDCRPRSHRVGLSHRGEIAEATLDALIDALDQLPGLRVKAEVSFELELVLAAGPRTGPLA